MIGDYNCEKYRWTVNAGNAVDAVNVGTERILFPVVYYKGYTAHGTDGTELNVSASDDGRVMVDLPSGFDGSFVLEFRSPFYWRISEIISLLTLMTVLAGIAKGHKPPDVEI